MILFNQLYTPNLLLIQEVLRPEYDQLCACESAMKQLVTIPECFPAFESIGTTAATRNSSVCSGECRQSVTEVLNVCQNQVCT